MTVLAPVDAVAPPTRGHLTTHDPVGAEGGRLHVLQGAATGSQRLDLAVAGCPDGHRLEGSAGERETLAFVLDGRGTLAVGDQAYAVERHTGVLVPATVAWAVAGAGPSALTLLVVSLVPSPDRAATEPALAALAEQEARAATGDRSFRIVHDPATGSGSATQFVGLVPPGRAPDHFHEYDEVIYVLAGEGVLHAEGQSTPFGAGATIHLPPRLVHCLENVGDAPLEVLGVFTPAGSPSDAFYPDGSRAYYDP